MNALAEHPEEVLTEVVAAMAEGARLDVVRLYFNPTQKWGVHVYKPGRTKGGNPKWVKIPVTLIPNDGENVADVLAMLGQMAAGSDS